MSAWAVVSRLRKQTERAEKKGKWRRGSGLGILIAVTGAADLANS